ncbi:phage portal protein [Lacticaseibacillus brantae]|uniref:Portal protein n=1 Tax=Lacticaseibacillus brantae DSM 23927 TaxID=1423727 RepID=A0A0R2B0Z5_9LACO|nr:phage portal protein [Lacticaseibacillus brantae]KRM73015.1 portal protein [Lacticaseibacillus brantae DSM 23927]
MSKKKKQQKRAAPALMNYVSSSAWTNTLATGYVRLSDNPDVRIAVDRIADLVSNMSIHLLQNTDKGDVRVHNGLERLIDVEPAHNMTRKAWITKIVRDLFLFGDGNSIAQIVVEPGSDYLSELRLLDMDHVSYQYDVIGKQVHTYYSGKELDDDKIVHFLINPNAHYPQVGTGYRRILSEILANLAQANKTKAEFMTGKNVPSLIVKVDADSEELSSAAGREEVRRKYLDTANANDPWIIPADMMDVTTVKPLTLEDIALNESVEIDKRTVAHMFGVPAFLLGVGEFNKDEYNNFVNTTIASIGQMIAQTLTKDILFDPSWYFAFSPRSLFSYDISELVSAGTQLMDRAAMDRNEMRGWVGMEPRDDMEDILMLENYLPTDKLGDQKKLNNPSTKGGDADDSKD